MPPLWVGPFPLDRAGFAQAFLSLTRQIAEQARLSRSSQTAVIEAALASFLSPDGAERTEAALARRLDRINAELKRLEWNVTLSNETLALFIRFWLASTPPLPVEARAGAHAKGEERWAAFVEALSRRMETGQGFGTEVAEQLGEDR